MNKITLAILTAAIAGFAAPASAQQSQIFAPKTPPTQRQSAQPPPNQRQFNQRQTTATPPAKATQPLPTFAIAVNGIAIQAARLRNHCVLDATIAADQTLITSIKNGFGGGGTYIAATIDCAGLTRLRAGNESGALEATLYAAVGDGQQSTLEKHDFARQACEAVTRAPGTQQVSGTPKERMEQLQQIGANASAPAIASLNSTRRACYVGAVVRSGDALILQTIGTTQIKGQRMSVTTISVNGSALPLLWNRAGTLVSEMSKANGEQ